MASEKILVVDDDSDIREILTLYLKNEGYKTAVASNGGQAIKLTDTFNPDLIILDIMLPDLDGIEVCQQIRKTTTAPIIFLSCKSTSNDKTIGLIAGGDDYIGKPFDSNELLARVRAQLRRNRVIKVQDNSLAPDNIISYPDLTIDLNRYSVVANGKNVVLPLKEFQLLVLLAKNPNYVFTIEQLYKAIWNSDSFGDYRTLIVHISNIRKKIEKEPKCPKYIQTIKGLGYKFVI